MDFYDKLAADLQEGARAARAAGKTPQRGTVAFLLRIVLPRAKVAKVAEACAASGLGCTVAQAGEFQLTLRYESEPISTDLIEVVENKSATEAILRTLLARGWADTIAPKSRLRALTIAR